MADKDETRSHIASQIERLTAPDQIDTLMVVVKRGGWIALWTLIVLIGLIFLWAIFGSIPIKVTGRGIALNRQGVFNITSETSGRISQLLVVDGQKVKKGELVAKVYNPRQQNLLEAAQIQVETLNTELAAFEKQLLKEEQVKKAQIRSKIQSTLFSIERLKTKIPALEKDLEAKKNLYDEGLVALPTVEAARQALAEAEIALEEKKTDLLSLRGDLSTADFHRTQEYQDRAARLAEAKEELTTLQVESNLSFLYAPDDGTVLEVLASVGDRVEPGNTIVWMEYTAKAQDRLLFYNYVPLEAGERIRPGQEVHLDLAIVSRQEEGVIIGHVVAVSQFAVSFQEVLSTVRNRELANYLTNDGSAVLQVIVEPVLNPDNPSGFAWTSGKGPDVQVRTGTVCRFGAIVEERRPISYLLPVY